MTYQGRDSRLRDGLGQLGRGRQTLLRLAGDLWFWYRPELHYPVVDAHPYRNPTEPRGAGDRSQARTKLPVPQGTGTEQQLAITVKLLVLDTIVVRCYKFTFSLVWPEDWATKTRKIWDFGQRLYFETSLWVFFYLLARNTKFCRYATEMFRLKCPKFGISN